MNRLLNRGLNFSILPMKLDITQTLVEFKRYERSAIWTEFWYGKDNEQTEEPIFRTHKTNYPKKYSSPEGLKIFLGSVKSEILDPRNRNNIPCNLPPDEIQALKELQELQRCRKIVIKACDKGAGIIILNFEDYLRSCYDHLTSKQNDNEPYYTQVTDLEFEQTKKRITNILKEGLHDGIINKAEFDAMKADDKKAGRFYMNFKVHKQHIHIPPPRPIVSGSGSITENIALFVESHIKHITTKHETYLQDTPDFLRCIQKINEGPRLHPKTMAVTWDVIGLYTNIKHNEGLSALKETLDKRTNKKVSTDYLILLMEIILKNNIFEFHDSYWKQEIGAAMGSRPIPGYANNFMAKFDKCIRDLAQKYKEEGVDPLKLFKRFLDDFILLFVGSSKKLHQLFEEVNRINPIIQLTMTHTFIKNEPIEDRCECEPLASIPFLDTLITIKEGKIDLDLYRKDTDRNQYLLPSSCHSKMTTQSIPFSLSLRIVRICNDTENRDTRLKELKNRLLDRSYQENVINRAIEKARAVPRIAAIRQVQKPPKTKGPVFAVTYDPRLPPLGSIGAKHWRSMTSRDTYLADVFKRPPLTAYKRQKNLRQHLVRAKVPRMPKPYPSRTLKGMKRCEDNCTSCPYIIEAKRIKINGISWFINKKVNCKSYNLVYAIICKKENCKLAYIGETKRMLRYSLDDHCGYVNNQLDTATGSHFSQPGHCLADLRVIVLEQIKKNCDEYRKEREAYFIRKFDTVHKGMNRKLQ